MKPILIFIVLFLNSLQTIAQKSIHLYTIPYFTNTHNSPRFGVEEGFYDVGFGINYTNRKKRFYYDASIERISLGVKIPQTAFKTLGNPPWQITRYSAKTTYTNWTLRLSGGYYEIHLNKFQGGLSFGLATTYFSKFEHKESFFLANGTIENEVLTPNDIDLKRFNFAMSFGLPFRWQLTDKLGISIHFLYQILLFEPNAIHINRKLYSLQCNFGLFQRF